MPIVEVKIPSVGESISSGLLSKWHIADGDIVNTDQALFELETDKITSEGTAPAAGKIALQVQAGTEVRIGQVVATIDTDTASGAQPTPLPAADSKPVGRPLADAGRDSGPPLADAGGDSSQPQSADAQPASAHASPSSAGQASGRPASEPSTEEKPSPEPKPKSAPPAQAPASTPKPPSPTTRQTRRKMSPLRQKIAQRLVAAQHEAAMLTTFNEADMSAIMALRATYQDEFVKKHGVKLGFMSFFVRAAVHALKTVPSINAQVDGDELVQNNYFDIGVAVSTEKGLMVPVIRDCDKESMAGIEKAIASAAAKARENKITLADLEGGVFTITNGGIFGSMLSTPILNPPQSAILGLHAIQERPVARAGQVVIRPMMYLALSYDHRVVDGRDAVTFLVAIKQVIEDPSRLMLGV